MRPKSTVLLTVPVLLALAACGREAPPDTVVIQQPPQVVGSVAPSPPPAPMSELVPPPPVSSVPMVWQPGHWRYTGVAGNPWSWEPGQYVALPPGTHAWVPGQWQQQGSTWIWREGHWA